MSILNRFRDKSISLSIPDELNIHGVRIWKLPNGQYLKALKTVQNLPELLLKTCFPDMKPEEVLDELKQLNEETLYQMVGRLINVIPEEFFRIVAELIDADPEYLINKLTPKETFEVLKAFWEMNDMTDFLAQIKAAITGSAALKKQSFGFKSFLQRR